MKTAYDILGEKGLEALHARTVAAALEINHATVHYYFPRRSDLLLAAAEFATQQFQTDRSRFRANLETPAEQVEGELALAEAYCKPNSRFAKALAALYTAAVEDPTLKAAVKKILTIWSKELADILPAAKIKKNSPFANPDLLVATLFGFALTAHLTEGAFDATTAIDDVFSAMFD